MSTRFHNIQIGNDGAFSGEEGPNAFGANFPLFLISEAWHTGCDFENLADGYGVGQGTMGGDWSGIRDSSEAAKSRMLEQALNYLFGAKPDDPIIDEGPDTHARSQQLLGATARLVAEAKEAGRYVPLEDAQAAQISADACGAHALRQCPICNKPPGTDEAEALADAAARAERISADAHPAACTEVTLAVTVDGELARELEAEEDTEVATYLAREVTFAIENALGGDNFAEGLIQRYRAFHVTVTTEEAN